MRTIATVLGLVFLIVSALAISSNGSASGFLSPPITVASVDEKYNYTLDIAEYWGNLTMTSTADWLVLYDDSVLGIPTSEDIGTYLVNLTLTNDVAVEYQNYTIDVTSSIPSNALLVVALVLGCLFIVLSIRDYQMMPVAGLVWLFIAGAVLFPFGVPYLLIGVVIGLLLFLEGVMLIASKGGN